MSVDVEKLGEVAAGAAGGEASRDAERHRQRLATWEDLLTLVVEPDHPRVGEPARKRKLLSHLLERSGIDERGFWSLSRAQRGRLFLSRYSSVSRDIPDLEITAFDIDKALKERFRREPLTLGAAWHHGFWRSYFSQAAITHPANDGLREEFSTAWDIVRKQPAVLFRTGEGQVLWPLAALRLDLPMPVGPLPWSDGETMGYLFVLQDTLNTCMYAAHGGTINLWDSGSRFGVAGQNKVHLADGRTLAPGFQSIHFGCPNEYAFEYLMSGGENSLHVVMGLRKPDGRGELSLGPTPYSGKFFMSGAAAGRVFVFDPLARLDPAQYHGNVLSAISAEEWSKELGPFIVREARRRGAPIRIEGEYVTMRLEGQWRRWRYQEAFAKLIPVKVAKALQEQGVVPPQLVQIVAE